MTDEGRRSVGPLLLIATLLAAPYVLFNVFTGMSWFDDEGALLVGFRSLLDGHRLYDDIYSLYGPLYNEFYGFIYGIVGVPLNHTASRLIAATLWLAYAAGFAAFPYYLTRSIAASAFSYLLVLTSLTDLMDSPGHPEELCLLLLATTLSLVNTIENTPNVGPLVGLGAAIAGLALVKINIGVFVGSAVALGLLHCTTRSTSARVASALVATTLFLLPFAIEALLWDFWWVKLYSLFSVLVIGAALLVFLTTPQRAILGLTDWWTLAAGAGLAGLIIVGGMMLMRSSVYAIFEAVVVQNTHFLRNWYIPFQVGPLGLLTAVASVLAALAYYLSGSQLPMHPYRDRGIYILRFAFVLLGVTLLRFPVLELRILAPFCWLLMVQPAGVQPQHSVSRGVAGLIGAVMSLYAFPVAGHQVNIAVLVPTMIVPVVASDLMKTLRHNLTDAPFLTPSRFDFLVMVSVLGIGSVATLQSARNYLHLVPVGLPGTSFIRETEKRVNDLGWITSQLSSCASSYSVPGMWSLAFWTGHALLTAQNINDVLAFIQPVQQRAIVQLLSRQPDLCVVYNSTYLQKYDRGQISADPPLLHYLDTHLVTVAEHDGFAILKQRTSAVSPSTGP